MPISMNDALDNAYQVSRQISLDKQKKRNEMMDYLAKKASIQESGYDIQGDELVQMPDYVSSKQARSRKDLADAAISEMKLERMRGVRPLGGAEPLPSGTQPLGAGMEGYKSYIDPNTGDEKVVKDPNYLNPLQQKTLDEKVLKQQDAEEADRMKEENLISAAENQLQAIRVAKAGKDYFGFLGDVPSIPVLTGDYAKRQEWESNINNLLSNKVVDLMNQMKNQSRTGATGFGALNKSELDLIRNASTVLNKRMAPEVAIKYLDQLEAVYQKIARKGKNIPTFNSEADIPPGFKGEAIVGGVEGTVN